MAVFGKVVILVSPKGGVTKSTTATVIANFLHENTDLQICVIDTDLENKTITNRRKLDLQLDPTLDEKNLYGIAQMHASEVLGSLETFQKSYDIVFIDYPAGTFSQEGAIDCMKKADMLFVPCNTSPQEIFSIGGANVILQKEVIKHNDKIKLIGGFTRVEKNSIDFKKLDRSQLPFPFLEAYIPYMRVTFQSEFNTIREYKNYEGRRITKEFCEEFLKNLITN